MVQAKSLEYWVTILSRADLPVLKQTARALTVLQQDEKRMTALTVADVIARDPIMTVKLLRYLQKHKHKIQTTEVVQVEQALLMLGIDTVFKNVAPKPLVEEMLGKEIVALTSLLQVLHRSYRASEFAKDWAVRLHDLHYEEVRIAALLHDIAELLMWCFAPALMMEIRDKQHRDKTLRSQTVQEQVLGFTLVDLQARLTELWGLPKLLLTLMNDANLNQNRVQNVILSVRFARHSAHGWDDAALPDDYSDIGALLRIPALQVMSMYAKVR